MEDDWQPDMTVGDLDLRLGRIARLGGQLDFGLRMLWHQVKDIREVDAIPLDVEARADDIVQTLASLQGMPDDERLWAVGCLIDVRVALIERNDALNYVWTPPMPDGTNWHQQRNGAPTDPHAVDVIDRTRAGLDDLVDRLVRLGGRVTTLGFALWEFTKPADFQSPQLDGQWAIVRDDFDITPEGGFKPRT